MNEDLVDVLPEEIEELLEEEDTSSDFLRFLRDSRLGKLLDRANAWLDKTIGGESEGVRDAGINLEGTSRRFGARMWRAAARKSALRSPGALDSPQDFAQLLQPLSPADVILLRKEIEADRTIISQIDTVRSKALEQQRKGMLLGILVGLFFALLAGPGYVLDTLYSPGTWGAVLFAGGILLPMVAVFQIAEGARMLFMYRDEPQTRWRRAGSVLVLLPLFSLLLLLLGAVPLAALPILVAWIWSKAERSQE